MVTAEPPEGTAITWRVSYRNIEYPGQVVIAQRWRPELGLLPPGDVHFRLVLCLAAEEVRPESLLDRRVAVALPASEPPAHILHEAQALYVAERRTVPNRRAALTALLSHWEAVYGNGRLVGQRQIGIDTRQLSGLPHTEVVQRLAVALLSAAYPALPLETAALQDSLTPARIRSLFAGLLGGETGPTVQRVCAAFAPALGLAAPEQPMALQARGCAIFPLLEEELARYGGNIPAGELYSSLSERGLTYPLTTLFLLAYLCQGERRTALRLVPGHRVTLRSGEPLSGDVLEGERAGLVRWQISLPYQFRSFSYSKGTIWASILPYIQQLEADFSPAADPQSLADQERRLVSRLGDLRASLETAEQAVALLEDRLGSALDEESRERLGRIKRLAEATDLLDFQAALRAAPGEYASPQHLAEDMDLCRRLLDIAGAVPEIAHVKAYLDGTLLREEDSNLSMDRVSILSQLSVQNLVNSPHLWEGIEAMFDWFRQRYHTAYQVHHQSYYQEMAALAEQIDRAKSEVEALQHLNSIRELGPPLGQDAINNYRLLVERVRLCPAGEAEDVAVEQPTCEHCGLPLTARLPSRETADVLARLHRALAGQYQRLSKETVRQLLAGGGEDRVERLLKIVQAADLSSLTNVMQEELRVFLQELLVEFQLKGSQKT